MKRIFFIGATAVLLLILAACGGTQGSEPAAAPVETEPDTAVTEPQEAEPVVEEAPAEEMAVEEVKNETAGKPQLIEFYADW